MRGNSQEMTNAVQTQSININDIMSPIATQVIPTKLVPQYASLAQLPSGLRNANYSQTKKPTI